MYSEKMGATQYEIEGKSLDECKSVLYKKYGSDYQIINQKTTLKGGIFGFGQREIVKVVYIINTRTSVPVSAANQNGYDEKDAFRKNRDEILKKQDPSVTSNLQLAQLAKKIDQLTETVSNKLETIEQVTNVHEQHPVIKKIEELLTANEFTSSYITNISERIRNNFSLDELEDFDQVQKTVIDWIGEDIMIAGEQVFRPPHVILLVGPTGVGKTTTIAKMAASIVLEAKNKELPRPAIKLLTIDKLRVGAQLQLKKYGEIMNISVDSAESVDEVKSFFNDYRSKLDYLLIDTSGFSPNDFENIGKMRAELEVPGLKPDVYLAIAAGTKARDIESILKNYETFNYRSVIITKCDETSTLGNILSVLIENKKPISWITNGQIVPHNIEKADKVKLLMKLQDFTIDRQHLEEMFKDNENSKLF